MENFFRSFDNFGYTPQFLQNGELVHKTLTGGIISISFILLATLYFVSQFVLFIQSRDVVISSRDIPTSSPNYNLTNKDIYFGIGITDGSQYELNLTSVPYIKIEFRFVYVESGNTFTNSIQLGPCDINKFMTTKEFNALDVNTQKMTMNKTSYYLCPQGDYSLLVSPMIFGKNKNFLSIRVSITSTSILDLAKDQLSSIRPRVNFIFRNIFVDYQNRYYPYKSSIESFYNELSYDFSKKTYLNINPSEIVDDDNLFGEGGLTQTKTNESNQINGTVFRLSRLYGSFGNIYNRTQPVLNSKNPDLEIARINLYLNSSKISTIRSFKKFK